MPFDYAADASNTGPVEALILMSFGGPNSAEEVVPFLANVTRGRGIPPERLEEVGKHYYALGGKSPLNELNLEIIDHLRERLTAQGRDLPVYFANRNWEPYLNDVVAELAAAGVHRAAVFATSAWGGYSGCAQYHEDIARARAAVGEEAPELVRLGQFFDAEAFLSLFADAASTQLAEAREAGEHPRLVFTAHSVPNAADDNAGPAGQRNLYSRQVHAAAAAIAERCAVSDYDVVWQSRSGPPQVPWLEPDIVDHADALADNGVRSIVVVPVGFISDHVEVVWDLDTELAQACAQHGMRLRRVDTPGPTLAFADLILDLLAEVESGAMVSRRGAVPSLGCTANGTRCTPDCCLPGKRPSPPPR